MKKLLFCMACLLMLNACSYQRFQITPNEPERTIPSYEGTSHFLFWGIAQTKKYNPNEVCGRAGVASVETHDSFLNGLLAGLTWGIYSPRTYTIYCNQSQNQRYYR